MKKPSLITVSLLGAVMLGLTAGLATAQVTTNLTAEADTYTRANVGAATAENLDVRGFGGGDFVGYVRFNLSSLPIETITSARFSLYRGVGSRNDSLVTGRFRNFGLTNAPGNTPQNWDEATLVDTTVNVGAEYTSVGGNQVNPANLFNLDADLGANVTETVVNTLDAESYITGPDLVTFLAERLNDDGLVTFINVINAGNRGYGFRSREHTNTAVLPALTIEYLPATGLSNLTWATGSGSWDIGTTANWQDEAGGSSTYQEVFGVGNRVLFEDSLSGASPITITLNTTVSPRSLTNNSTKNWTVSGTGAIAGAGEIVKDGSGILTFNTINTYTGPLYLNDGTLNFSSGGNLGDTNAPILFDGGTLQYASGSYDISEHPITFNAGGGTIDTPVASFVFLANAIGGGGAGGLTKAGAGTLALADNNIYSGNTVVSGGTLRLEFDNSIPNSPAIVLGSGAILDVLTPASNTLSSTANQILAGTGSTLGAIVAPANTTVSPATNGVVGTITLDGLTVNGGTLAIDISNVTGDVVNSTYGFDLQSGTVALNITGGPLANGTYTIMTYSGSLQGSAANLAISGFAQAGQVAFLSDANPGQIDLIIAPLSSKSLVWQGDGSANVWDLGTTANWLDGAIASVFNHGDSATFNDSGSASPPVNLSVQVFPSAVAVNASQNYTISGSGSIGLSAGLTKSGSGSLTINTTNNYTGGTVINAGAVVVNGHIGSGAINNSGSLTFNQADSYSVGSVTGTGPLTKNGTGTLTVSGNADYTGATTIGAGATLQLGSGGAVNLQTPSVANAGLFVLNTSADQSYSGTISGTGSFTKDGAGSLTLSADGTYAGATTVEGGALVAGGQNFIGDGALSVNAGGTFELGGFDQAVDGLGGADGTIVNDLGSATNTLTLSNAADLICNTVILDNTGSGGAIAIEKYGTNQQQFSVANSFSGGLTIHEGTVRLASDNSAAGTGPINMAGGRLLIQNNRNIANPIDVQQDSTVEGQGNMTLNGPLSGSGANTLTCLVDTTFSMAGGMNGSPFAGTLLMASTNGLYRYYGWTGSDLITFDMGTGGAMAPRNRDVTIQIGALTGGTSASLSGAASSDQVDFPSGYSIGAKNLDTTYQGTITDAAANRITFITKTGTGKLTLSGTLSYTGDTTVESGTLAIAGAGELDDSANIAINSGATLDYSGVTVGTPGTLTLGSLGAQTLSGAGTLEGSLAAGGSSTVAPGDGGTGILTVTNSVALGGAVLMELDRDATPNSDQIVSQSRSASGTLTVTNINGRLAAGNTFQLFNGPISGFSSVSLPTTGPSYMTYTWTDNLNVDGSITVASAVSSVPLTATNLTYTVTNGTLVLSWPASYTGWSLETQTNPINVGLSTNWTVVPGSETNNVVAIPIDQNTPTAFYRMFLW